MAGAYNSNGLPKNSWESPADNPNHPQVIRGYRQAALIKQRNALNPVASGTGNYYGKPTGDGPVPSLTGLNANFQPDAGSTGIFNARRDKAMGGSFSDFHPSFNPTTNPVSSPDAFANARSKSLAPATPEEQMAANATVQARGWGKGLPIPKPPELVGPPAPPKSRAQPLPGVAAPFAGIGGPAGGQPPMGVAATIGSAVIGQNGPGAGPFQSRIDPHLSSKNSMMARHRDIRGNLAARGGFMGPPAPGGNVPAPPAPGIPGAAAPGQAGGTATAGVAIPGAGLTPTGQAAVAHSANQGFLGDAGKTESQLLNEAAQRQLLGIQADMAVQQKNTPEALRAVYQNTANPADIPANEAAVRAAMTPLSVNSTLEHIRRRLPVLSQDFATQFMDGKEHDPGEIINGGFKHFGPQIMSDPKSEAALALMGLINSVAQPGEMRQIATPKTMGDLSSLRQVANWWSPQQPYLDELNRNASWAAANGFTPVKPPVYNQAVTQGGWFRHPAGTGQEFRPH